MAKVCVEFEGGDGGTPSPVRAYTTTLGDGTTTDFVVMHNLNSLDVLHSLRNLTNGELNEYDVTAEATDPNRLALHFTTAPAANSARLSVLSAS